MGLRLAFSDLDAASRVQRGGWRWCCAVRMIPTERAPTMTDTPQTPQEPEDEEADRRLTNIVLVVGFVVLVGGGIWLANAMIDARKADECISSGRRNCNPIEAPAR